MTLLIIDNYDSFTHNLYQAFGELGAAPTVLRNDAIDLAGIRELAPAGIVLSPGPGHPGNARDFGVCAAVLSELPGALPILGVCLGHQGIALAYGGRVVRAPRVVHGKTSPLRHDGSGLFAGVEQGTPVMRYHSLIAEADTLPDCLRVTATSGDDDLPMAVVHAELPVFGLQFHPESFATPAGPRMLRNFLEICG